MDRRTLLALGLTALVIMVTPILFPAPPRPPMPVDSTLDTTARAPAAAVAAPSATPSPTPPRRDTPRAAAVAPAPAVRPETTTVETGRAIFQFVSPGATPTAVVLPEYRSLRPGAVQGAPVSLVEPGDRLLSLALQTGNQVVSLDTVRFRFQAPRRDGATTIQSLTSVGLARPVSLTYRFLADSFIVTVDGTVPGGAGSRLFVSLPARIHSDEANLAEDASLLAIAWRNGTNDAESVRFGDLDTIPQADSGSIRWIAERNKYFVVAAFPSGPDTAFTMFVMRTDSVRKVNTIGQATAMLPLTSDRFSLRVYAGPQSWKHLLATAGGFENVNPYGGWLHGVVQPFATIVMRLILWTRDTLNIGYGMVLVVFGVAVRLLMWPLNQNAMRSSLQLQRIQPQMQEIQTRYRSDPEKLRAEMMKLYQEHGMNPFAPILGCLPMLLPMPILFALYFVFQNTIELRGVSFLWLPDLSLKDPLYVTPLFMGISMYVLSWIGMRGLPPNPQSKMMLYVMPVMFTVLFWNFASGLNLYYAVQNVAALPQQWLLAHERVKQGGGAVKKPGGKGGG